MAATCQPTKVFSPATTNTIKGAAHIAATYQSTKKTLLTCYHQRNKRSRAHSCYLSTHKTLLPPHKPSLLPRRLQEMDTAVGAATWLVGKVLNKLSNDLVAAYVASFELGLNSEQIKTDLRIAGALLCAAQGRDVHNPDLQWLLEELSKKADEAEDALDELHYFIIQDQLDSTQHVTPDLGGNLQEKVQHGGNAVRHIFGNWLPRIPYFRTKDDDSAVTAAPDNPPHKKTKCDGGDASGHVDKLTFDRVDMSIKIKSVIEGILSKCVPVSDLLKIPTHSSTTGTTVTINRPLTGSTIVQDKLYGRRAIFQQTIEDITNDTYHGETLSVLPIVGPGGIGKTTFTQHLYNDERAKEHFTVRVWVCVSTDFDLLKLTQQIHGCIPATEKEESNITSVTNNLDQLQISIAHRLKSKRFLIVLDDVWKCDSDVEWNNLLAPLTKGEAKGSMVLVTTRFPKIQERVKKAIIPINLQGLDPQEFFEFFLACVFGENKPDQKYNELIEIGKQIAKKLKCSPLAAKTVTPLLRKHLSQEHWMKVLESNEWKDQTKGDSIMPALKISYDYLPFHLKQCFPYFSLFPEDHKFKGLEITRFWTAIGIIENKDYLEELVDNGFLMKDVNDDLEDQCYVMHDLLHELSQSVSSQECLNISSSLNFRADSIPQSIRHLSITIEDRYNENFRKEMAKVKSKINIGSLRTLMIFRKYEERIAEILKDTFEEIKGLRVLFIVMNSPESLPKNFSKLLHLRYLKITTPRFNSSKITLPSTLPRFYHLIFLDLEDWYGSASLPRYISRLVNLRHFIADSKFHSNVPEVGKIEHLEELKEFDVKKYSVGFELEELGKLTNLGGQLRICNLEKVATKEEANKANLCLKKNLKKLELVWGKEQLAGDADVLDGLQPHDNLAELAVIDDGGVIGPPDWLFVDIPIKHLESLTLEGVCWGTLPPFGQLPCLKRLRLKNIAGVRLIGPELGFRYLTEVRFVNMPDLEKWIVEPDCHLFPMLASIRCEDCPNLFAVPFLLECFGPCTQDYPTLLELRIIGCPKLSLPPMPHTSTLTHVEVDDSPVGCMIYEENRLELSRYSSALAFHNMGKVERIIIREGSNVPWTELEKLTVRQLHISGNSSIRSMARVSNFTSLTDLRLVDCENLRADGFNPLITAVNLKRLVVVNGQNHPRSIAVDLLSEVVVAIRSNVLPAGSFRQLGGIAVDSISAVLVAPICTLLAATLRELYFIHDDRVEGLREEEEKALQLLTSLKDLSFWNCPGLPSLPQGLHTLPSLRTLNVTSCPEIRSLPEGGLPASLQCVEVEDVSAELKEQVEKLRGTIPGLYVSTR